MVQVAEGSSSTWEFPLAPEMRWVEGEAELTFPRYVGEVMASLTSLLLGPDGSRCRAAAEAITRVLSNTR